jgi:ketosteroid isomerase-like protein
MEAVASALDAEHLKARDAFRRKDERAYMEIFTDDLSYEQPDGRVIGREQLRKNVRSQLTVLHSAEGSYKREELELHGQEVTEHLRQTTSFTSRHFGILYRTWNIHRAGKYVWIKTDDGWRVRLVIVLQESVTLGGSKLFTPSNSINQSSK